MDAHFGLLGVLLFLLLSRSLGAEGVESFDPVIRLPRSGREYEAMGNGSRNKHVLSVDEFGAAGDGVSDDTQAFRKAWKEACSSSLPIKLRIPAGKQYLVGPIDFGEHCTSNVTLQISGTIVAPDDPAVWDNRDPHKWLYFHSIKNLKVRGGGTINGMGSKWWARSCKTDKRNPCRHAPTAITFHRCQNLKVHKLVLLNSQQMHMAFTSCSRVKVSNMKVTAPSTSPNTDGIHVSESSFVVIKNSIIETGDDCISIVNGSSRLQIKNITCGPGHGISIGSLGKSHSWAEVYDVRVKGAVISNTENGLRIKTWQGGRGIVRNITFQNVTMKNVSNPIIIDQYYCDSSKPCQNQTDAVNVTEVSYTRIKGTSATKEAIRFACSDTVPCRGIHLKDIELYSEYGGSSTAFCWNALGTSNGSVMPSCFSKDHHCIKQKADKTIPLLDYLFKSLIRF